MILVDGVEGVAVLGEVVPHRVDVREEPGADVDLDIRFGRSVVVHSLQRSDIRKSAEDVIR